MARMPTWIEGICPDEQLMPVILVILWRMAPILDSRILWAWKMFCEDTSKPTNTSRLQAFEGSWLTPVHSLIPFTSSSNVSRICSLSSESSMNVLALATVEASLARLFNSSSMSPTPTA